MMMQRREGLGRKAASQAMIVIAESIRASRGRRGKETPLPQPSQEGSISESKERVNSESATLQKSGGGQIILS